MSRRRRIQKKLSARAQLSWAKQQRRRARGGVGRAATATTTAVLGLAGLAPAAPAMAQAASAPAATCTGVTPSSSPEQFVAMGGRVYFVADDGLHGRSLWTSDGTPAGTVLIKGSATSSGGYDEYTGVSDLAVAGSRVFFTFDDGNSDTLWTTDGSAAGTVLVKTIDTSGGSYGGPSDLVAVGDSVFFTADDGIHGEELWTSDGTPAGTVLVKDINPNNASADYDYSYGPDNLTAVGQTLYFTTDDGVHGRELWKSDGTAGGTVLVKDIRPGDYSADPVELTAAGDRVFFSARDGVHGPELWASDGTEAGTVLVKDVNPGFAQARPRGLTPVGTQLFFTAEDGSGRGLWVTDGTEGGTVLLKPGSGADAYYDDYSYLAANTAQDTLFFTTSDPAHGRELWVSDGTPAGTVLLKDIYPGGYDSRPTNLTAVGDHMFFSARDGVHGPELWKSDGTAAGTVLVKDIAPGARIRSASWLTLAGDTLFFRGDDGVHGRELWASDGTEAGTAMVTDINRGGAFELRGSPKPDKVHGTLAVKVRLQAAGTLKVTPVGASQLRSSTTNVTGAGTTTVTLRPTKAGLRTLRRTGRLVVRAKITWTPCGGTGNSVTRRYVLLMA